MFTGTTPARRKPVASCLTMRCGPQRNTLSRSAGTATCASTWSKLAEVQERIRELAALQGELEQLRERARRLDPADCTDADICRILAQHD